jgi:uncharacterized protein (DUF1778 family)
MSVHFALVQAIEEANAMPTPKPAPSKRETLNIRIKPEERGLLDRAARARGKNRTDFMLDAARLAAEQTLLDQTVIAVSPEIYCQTRHASPPQRTAAQNHADLRAPGR